MENKRIVSFQWAYGCEWCYAKDLKYDTICKIHRNGKIEWRIEQVPEEVKIRIFRQAARYANEYHQLQKQLQELKSKLLQCREDSKEYYNTLHNISWTEKEIAYISKENDI